MDPELFTIIGGSLRFSVHWYQLISPQAHWQLSGEGFDWHSHCFMDSFATELVNASDCAYGVGSTRIVSRSSGNLLEDRNITLCHRRLLTGLSTVRCIINQHLSFLIRCFLLSVTDSTSYRITYPINCIPFHYLSTSIK